MFNKLLIVFLVCLCSCTIDRRLYSSNQPNNPSLQKKNDCTVSAAYGSPSGFDVNGGYAITNWLSVIGGFHYQQNKDWEKDNSVFSTNRDSSLLSYKHKGYHFGAGSFIPLNKNSSDLIFSFYAGLTKGSFRMNETLYRSSPAPSVQNNFYTSDLTRWFGQAALTVFEKKVNQSFLVRYNYVGYSHVETDYSIDEQENYLLPTVGYPRWSQFLDFALETKLFFTNEQRLGLSMYGVLTTRLNRKESNFPFYGGRVGVGLILKSPFQKAGRKG